MSASMPIPYTSCAAVALQAKNEELVSAGAEAQRACAAAEGLRAEVASLTAGLAAAGLRAEELQASLGREQQAVSELQEQGAAREAECNQLLEQVRAGTPPAPASQPSERDAAKRDGLGRARRSRALCIAAAAHACNTSLHALHAPMAAPAPSHDLRFAAGSPSSLAALAHLQPPQPCTAPTVLAVRRCPRVRSSWSRPNSSWRAARRARLTCSSS